MSEILVSTSSVMEGRGAYNKHVKLPAGGASLALPLLEKAIQNMEIGLDGGSVVIADYGSSQGKNSLAPMQFAIRGLRSRIGEDRPILVFHIDQPTNDFNSLFEVLATDPDRYIVQEPRTFPCAIGRSFYEQVLPPESVHLGWSCYAAVWLSRIPALIPGHFISLCSAGATRAAFERQGAQDWETFLSLRASEMLPGGRLVVVLPGVAENGLSGFEGLMNHANGVLAEMAREGAITVEEQARMVLANHLRCRAELLAPFARNGRFQDLTVEAFDESVLSDSAWTDYERDGASEALAAKHALFFRSVFMPSLASALTRVRDGDAGALTAFGDRLEEGLKGRLAKEPLAIHSFVHTIALAK
jgi:hypothetical protein